MISFLVMKGGKDRELVEVPDAEVTAITFHRKTKYGAERLTYAYRAHINGHHFFRWCGKTAFESHTGPKEHDYKEPAQAPAAV